MIRLTIWTIWAVIAIPSSNFLFADLVASNYYTTGLTQIGIANVTDDWTGDTAGLHYSAEVNEADSYSAVSSAFASLSNIEYVLSGEAYATHGFQEIPNNYGPTSASSFTQLGFQIASSGMYRLDVDIASTETTDNLVFGSAGVQIFDNTNSQSVVVYESDSGEAFSDRFLFYGQAGNEYTLYGTAGATIRDALNTASGRYSARLTAVPEPIGGLLIGAFSVLMSRRRKRTTGAPTT